MDTHEKCSEERESARSKVRRVVTYVAALYVFGGAIALIAASFVPSVTDDTMQKARTAYMLAAPLAGMIVGWWFAKRDDERHEALDSAHSGGGRLVGYSGCRRHRI